ncbi:MAG: mechanosensitive ion channel family protein [Acidimicrobiaceae bacterium]|nr:mechanosensitive ion channel family protein [Acidimicrobiaceae bacterium]
MADRQSSPRRFLGPWVIVAALFIVGSLLLILLDTAYKNIPFRDSIAGPLRAVIILIVGSVIAKVVESRILTKSMTSLSPRQRTISGFAVRLLLYLGLTLAVFAGLGIGLSSFLFGGAFLTVVIGLAGQSMLSNLFGGVWLVLFQPFQVSDSISFITWQYPILMPSYPHEALKPAYSGRVTDINLMYTTIVTDDGDPLVLPNGVLAQSAIINRSRSGARKVTVRFDAPIQVSPNDLKTKLLEDLGSWDRPPSLELSDIGIANYSVRVSVWSRENDERIRDRILQSAWRVMTKLSQSNTESGNPQETS